MSAPGIVPAPSVATPLGWTAAVRFVALLQEVPILGGTFFQVQISEHSAIKRKLVHVFLFLRIPRVEFITKSYGLGCNEVLFFSLQYAPRRIARPVCLRICARDSQ